LTLETRERQLHDDSLSCGNQPANMRLINRRIESALLLVHFYIKENQPRLIGGIDRSIHMSL